MAKEIEFCEDLIKYLEKHGFHELVNVPIKYKDGINTIQVKFYPKEFKNVRELKPETPFVGFEIDDETDGFVRGWLSDKGVTTKQVYYNTYDELDSFFNRITESKKSARKSIKESRGQTVAELLQNASSKTKVYIYSDSTNDEFEGTKEELKGEYSRFLYYTVNIWYIDNDKIMEISCY